MPHETPVLAVDPHDPEPEPIARAAEVLCAGGLVAFPTETVYGLGANALDAAAVQRIFTAKGRPANNPLIVHVADVSLARQLTTAWPDSAVRLAERFWPGPLSLVLPKAVCVPDIVTAGAATVALRVPSHPVALALLRAARLPVAAPSANRSNQVSPTRAEHVLKGLAGRIDLLLDAGPTPGGLESTVLDLSTDRPRLLRPGLVTAREIEAVIGPITRPIAGQARTEQGPLASPGMLSRHYAPNAALELVSGSGAQRVEQLRRQGVRAGWLTLVDGSAESLSDEVFVIQMPNDPAGYSAALYATLHAMDEAGVERIVAELPPESDEWLAVHDRLRRASH